jgi:hypothetical protein
MDYRATPGESGLIIGGRRVPMGKKQRRLLMQLHKERGRVVPTATCALSLEARAVICEPFECMVRINRMLAARKIPLAVTVARGIGHALARLPDRLQRQTHDQVGTHRAHLRAEPGSP